MKTAPEGVRSETTGDSQMDVHLIKMWASPSTLHLRVMVTGRKKTWSQFADIHIPLDALPAEVRSLGLVPDREDSQVGLDGRLF